MSLYSDDLGYRVELDGLRGLAVLLVVLYHLFPWSVPGGYVGVDVFFVLSGFFITRLLMKDLRQGRFSLTEFYRRRVRRLFPALIVVLLGTLAVGKVVLFPDEYWKLGQHALAAAGMAANFLQWSQANYFDTAARLKPLFHTWSLGIEEQFYLVWPVLLLALHRAKWASSRVIFTLTLLAFGVCVHLYEFDPTGAYYSPLGRAWELGAGAFLALVSHPSRAIPREFREAAGVIGLFLILRAAFLPHRWTTFSTFWIVTPVLGACLLIWAGPEAGVHRYVFSKRIWAGLGRISYPFYLWHYPLLAFLAVLELESPWARLCAVGLAVLLAWATYRFVERPIRDGGKRTVRQLAFGLGACASLGGLAFWEGVVASSGQPAQFQACVKFAECSSGLSYETSPGKDPSVVVIGDSQAVSLGAGANEESRAVLFLAKVGCLPLYGVEAMVGDQPQRCHEFFNGAIEWASRQPSVKTVILTGLYSTRRDRKFEHLIFRDRGREVASSNLDAFEAGLRRTFSVLRAARKQVVFLHENPVLSFNPRNCLERRIPGSTSSCREPKAELERKQLEYRAVLAQVTREFRDVREFDPLPILCESGYCPAVKEGQLIYSDPFHVNSRGAQRIWEALRVKFPTLEVQF